MVQFMTHVLLCLSELIVPIRALAQAVGRKQVKLTNFYGIAVRMMTIIIWTSHVTISLTLIDSGRLFTKRWDVLPPNLVKSRSREIGCYNDRIALSEWTILNPNLAASGVHEILP